MLVLIRDSQIVIKLLFILINFWLEFILNILNELIRKYTILKKFLVLFFLHPLQNLFILFSYYFIDL